jgi:proteasome lid subunit RPN8/RPN11
LEQTQLLLSPLQTQLKVFGFWHDFIIAVTPGAVVELAPLRSTELQFVRIAVKSPTISGADSPLMLESHTENALATWTVSQCAFTIEYSLRVIDDIRLAVVDAFFSLPRGGAEIGGILLGVHAGKRMTITDYVPLDCEHSTGPSFVLSAKDHAKLAVMLAAARGNPGGSEPVGWYHSHTRSDIYLTAPDIEIHRRYFPEPWQVALVIKPHTFQPARAGFFFQESDGSMRATASYQEFVLEPLAVRPLPDRPLVEDTPPAAPIRREPEFANPVVAAPVRPKEEPAAIPREEVAVPAAPFVVPRPATPPKAETASKFEEPSKTETLPEREPAELLAPAFTRTEPQQSWGGLGILAALTIGLACGAAAYQTRDHWLPHIIGQNSQNAKPPYIGLSTSDRAGQLQIRWDRESPAVRAAESGTLVIEDSAVPQAIDLDAIQLHGGSLTYGRQSERVDVVLTIHGPAGKTLREASTYLGKLPDPASELPASKPQDNAKELRGRNKKLEKTVDELRLQIEREQKRKRMENQSPDSVKQK